jgi:hypothetical protein
MHTNFIVLITDIISRTMYTQYPIGYLIGLYFSYVIDHFFKSKISCTHVQIISTLLIKVLLGHHNGIEVHILRNGQKNFCTHTLVMKWYLLLINKMPHSCLIASLF